MACRPTSDRRKSSAVSEGDFVFRHLEERGRLHFFYHSPSSQLPIRDVLGEQGHNKKTEPHIVRIPGQGGHDSEIIPVSVPKLSRSRFRDEVGQ